MPEKLNPFFETLVYKDESPDKKLYLEIKKPRSFYYLTPKDDIDAIVELYDAEHKLLYRIDTWDGFDISFWEVKPQWVNNNKVEITANFYLHYNREEKKVNVIDERLKNYNFVTVNKDTNGISFQVEYMNCKMSFSYHNQAVILKYDSCGENQHYTQDELLKIQEGFYRKFQNEWLQETSTVIRGLQLPRFSYTPDLYLKFLLHPETVRTDWKALEQSSVTELHKKIEQIINETKMYEEVEKFWQAKGYPLKFSNIEKVAMIKAKEMSFYPDFQELDPEKYLPNPLQIYFEIDEKQYVKNLLDEIDNVKTEKEEETLFWKIQSLSNPEEPHSSLSEPVYLTLTATDSKGNSVINDFTKADTLQISLYIRDYGKPDYKVLIPTWEFEKSFIPKSIENAQILTLE